MPDNKPQLLEEAEKANESFFVGIYQNLRLIGRLLRDKRVPIWLKILPVGALIYLVWPMDLFPIVPIDDAFVLYLGGYLFIELCPPDVVQEHRNEIERPSRGAPPNSSDGDVIEANFREVEGKDGMDVPD